MKRPLPLQSLLLIFVPLTIAIILITLWGLNTYQTNTRQNLISREQRTALLAAQLIERDADYFKTLSIIEQEQYIRDDLLIVLNEDSHIGTIILNAEQEIVFASDPLHEEDILKTHPGVAEALAGNTGITEKIFGDELHIVTYTPVPSLGWAIVLEETWLGLRDMRQNAFLLIPLLLIPLVLVAIFILWATNQWVLNPLKAVNQMAQTIGEGQYQLQVPAIQGVSELVDLQTELKQMAIQLEKAEQQMRGLTRAIQQGQEAERARVSRELHDDTIQSLVHLDQKIQLIQARANSNQIQQHHISMELDALRQEASQISQNVRHLIQELHPTYLDELGLVPALEIYVQELESRYKQQFIVEIDEAIPRLPTDIELALYRIVQESMSNAIKHAQANQITLRLKSIDKGIQLSVNDNGVGFDVDQPKLNGYGLLTIQARAEAIDAKVRIWSSSEGSRIQIVTES